MSRFIPTIRQMQPADVESVAAMMEALAAYHGDEIRVRARDFLDYGLGPNKLAMIWLATVGQEPAGFAVGYDWMNFVRGYPVRHIDLLFVREQFRQNGIGSALVKRIVSDAKVFGSRRVTVGASMENSVANNFYRQLGFEPRDFNSTIQYQISGHNFDSLSDCA